MEIASVTGTLGPPEARPAGGVAPRTATPTLDQAAGGIGGPAVDSGIPGAVLAAYHRAAESLARSAPACRMPWFLLAGIGRVESQHAYGGRVDPAGTTRGPILGPRLDGGPGIAAIADTDGGRLDGDTVWDRAVGPMQFIPGTWSAYAQDGNADGIASPHNIHDAALAAGGYLCAGGGDLSRRPDQLAALYRYNRSTEYGLLVLRIAAAYAGGVDILVSEPGAVPAPAPQPAEQPNGPAVLAQQGPLPTSPGPSPPAPTSAVPTATLTAPPTTTGPPPRESASTPPPTPTATSSPTPTETTPVPPTETTPVPPTETTSPPPTETTSPPPTETSTPTPTGTSSTPAEESAPPEETSTSPETTATGTTGGADCVTSAPPTPSPVEETSPMPPCP